MLKSIAWLRIARLQFYPMTLIAYSIGAAAAYKKYGNWDLSSYLIGYLILFFIELATVLTNEYFDYPTDRINKNAGLFTGGSRMLVEGFIKFKAVKKTILILLILIPPAVYLLIRESRRVPAMPAIFLVFTGIILGLGYTAPPLKLTYRGLGELDVGFTHSPYVILCGFFFQTGRLNEYLPYLLSIPLLFAVIAAIIMAGIPDYAADKSVSKKTLPLILGPERSSYLAIFFIVMAAAAFIMLCYFKIISGWPVKFLPFMLIHAAIIFFVTMKFIQSKNYDRKIDSLMQLNLSFILWFGLLPLLSLVI